MSINIQFIDRSKNLGLAFRDSVVCAGVGLYGVAASVVSIATFCHFEKINRHANYSFAIGYIVPKFLDHTIKVIKPNAQTMKKNEPYLKESAFFTKMIFHPFLKYGCDKLKSRSRFDQKVLSRVGFAVGGVLGTVTKVMDLALGLIVVPVTLFPFHDSQRINEFALRQLATGTSVVVLPLSTLRAIMCPKAYMKSGQRSDI